MARHYLAGSVKARRAPARDVRLDGARKRARHLVTSSVLQFPYKGHGQPARHPGHQDFSEDTYRTLAAADAAVMLIDAAKGSSRRPSSSSRCAHARNPIFTFCTSSTATAASAELMDELEKVLAFARGR